MGKRPIGRDELVDQLRDHIAFIKASCGLFDTGHDGEAKRIATSIRVLVHDTSVSHSILQQLGYKSSLQFISLAIPNRSSNLGPYWGLLDVEITAGTYVPKLDQVAPRPMPFGEWWQEPVLKDGDGNLYSRSELVLALANKDGGAHVDPDMDEAYERLSRRNHVGVEVAVRQACRLAREPCVPLSTPDRL
jgi:hypothetical protein